MAGDWIKMRMGLSTSPKVVRIASALCADRFRVIGGLHAVWCLFDEHSTDGRLDGYTLEALDESIGFPGIGAAMHAVGWLEIDGLSLCVPRFDEHNGQSAKRRAMEAQRKREGRKASADDADKKRTREEKRRDSVPKGTGADAPTDRDRVFAVGVSLLTVAGVAEKSARSFLALQSKQHGDAALLDALQACAEAKPVQPVPWLVERLGGPSKPRKAPEWVEERKARAAEFLGPLVRSAAKPDNVIDMEEVNARLALG